MGRTKTKDDSQPELLPRAETTDIPAKPPNQAKAARPKPEKPKQEIVVQKRSPAPAKQDAISTISVLKILADAAADPNVNPDKMRALLEMQKEIRAAEAKQSFADASITMRPKLPTISAKGRIVIEGRAGKAGQNTPYATFNEVHKRVTPILSEHGFVMSFAPDALPDGRLVMTATLEHRDGHATHGRIVLPAETSGSKNNVQGVGSAISYGKRYLMVTMLNLISEASEDVDDDGQAAGKLERSSSSARPAEIQTMTEKQVTELRKAIEACGASEAMFCNHFSIDKLEDLPPAQLGEAKMACTNFADRRRQQTQRGEHGASNHQG